jgi:hypothetical protein
LLAFAAILWLRPAALPIAVPFLFVWLVSPLIAWWLSRTVVLPRLVLDAADANRRERETNGAVVHRYQLTPRAGR